MNQRINRFLLFMVMVSALWGCAQGKKISQAESSHAPPPVGTISETAAGQHGQIPEEIVAQASEIHGGSMIPSKSADAAGQNAVSQSTGSGGITLILGPINAERVRNHEDVSSGAGLGIREIISQKLTTHDQISLFDAPEERFIDDSPRPDLSRRGVKYVIKGVASTGSDSGETTVFLRAVETMTGKVAWVASARHDSQNQAAAAAAERLLEKITGEK